MRATVARALAGRQVPAATLIAVVGVHLYASMRATVATEQAELCDVPCCELIRPSLLEHAIGGPASVVRLDRVRSTPHALQLCSGVGRTSYPPGMNQESPCLPVSMKYVPP